MSIQRYATSIFCDDVRREVGNKVSYMGIYTGLMYLNMFPAVLPRFCIAIQAVTPVDRPFDFLKFKILADDIVIAEQMVSGEVLLQKENDQDIKSDDGKVIIAGAVIQLQPFTIEKPTKLSVRIENEDEELKALSLNILSADTLKTH